MRCDRDAIDRGSACDRDGSTGVTQLLASHTDTSADTHARLQIEHGLSGYADAESGVHGALLLALSAYCDSGVDVYARIRIGHNMSGYADTSSDVYARLRIDHLLSGYVDTSSDVHGALLLALAAYVNSGSDTYARLQIGHNLSGYVDTSSDAYARLQITHLIAALTDTTSDAYARLQITHNLGAIADSVSDVYAMLRQVDSWTITFTGTLAAGKTVCINSRDFTVKNDGVNAIADFSGDFPSIFPGTNWVIYTDSEGSRTVRIVVSKQDRKV
jgi:hypothetical protein